MTERPPLNYLYGYLIVCEDADLSGDSHGGFGDRFGVEVGVFDEGAGGGEGVGAAGADSGDAVVGLDDVAVAADKEEAFAVGDEHQGVEMAEHLIRSPFLGELDGGAAEVVLEGVELLFELVLKGLGIGDGAGEAADDSASGEAADLFGAVLQDGGVAQGHLAIGGDGGLSVAAYADHRGRADHSRDVTLTFFGGIRVVSNVFPLLTPRALPWMIAFFFGGAALLGLLALAQLLGQIHAQPVILMLCAVIPLVIAGLLAQQVLRLNADVLHQRESRSELLEAQLEQQRQAVDELADGLDVAIFICDGRAVIAYANKRASELFRLQNPVGRSVLAVTLSYELERLVIEAAQKGVERNAELTFAYPDERMGLAKAWSPSPGENRVFLSVYEITELRRLERVRQDFVANVSHELRTPMTLIRAMAETLLDDMPDDGGMAHRYLTKTIGEVDRLSTITQDLLILSAAESNPVRKQVCDIADLFRGVSQELTQKAADKGLEVRYTGVPELRIEANPSQMKQVALNLVDNAINYTFSGSITVDCRSEGNEAVIEITDTGIGIASEYLDRIFERFYRVDKGRSRNTGGTGLGLSIVKHIVEAHGGTVKVESRLNQGSTFTVRLPRGDIYHPETLEP